MTKRIDLFGAFLAKGSTYAGRMLADLAATANAVDAWMHAAHLMVTGTGFAGDHAMLYADAYAAAGEAFDSLMERGIGLSQDTQLAAPGETLRLSLDTLQQWPAPTEDARALAANALGVVNAFVRQVKMTTDALRDSGDLTQGTDNLLAQLADDFEVLAYKFGQRSAGGMGKGDDVDALIKKLMASGQSKSSAIAILKANGTIKQDGAHLVMGQAAAKKAKPVKTMLV